MRSRVQARSIRTSEDDIGVFFFQHSFRKKKNRNLLMWAEKKLLLLCLGRKVS